VFSASIEIVLTIAYREAVARRHAYLTLEHLLYALAHDPEGERILQGCGADLPRLRRELSDYLDSSVEELRRGQEREPEQTAAFRRVLQTAVLHVQSAQKQEVHAGDVLAAILQQPRAHAASLLEAQGITRLDVLEFISHGTTKTPPADDNRGQGEATAGLGDEGPATSRDALAAYCMNLTERARNGQLDPLIGRTAELQRTIEVLCRRRKNNPVFVGEAGVGKTAMAEGLASRLLADDVPDILEGAEVFSLDTGALLAGTRFRGDFEERFKAVIKALSHRPRAILFIDEIHSTVGAGATTGGHAEWAQPKAEPGRSRRFQSIDGRFDPPDLPGFLAEPNYLRSGGFAEVDYRQPLNARKGGWYRFDASRYHDRTTGTFSFNSFEADVRQFASILAERRVFAARALVTTTNADAGAEIPFYLLPTLGGNDTLRGFRSQRFRGPHRMLMQAEYRWEIWSAFEAALFVDAGKVAMRRADLNFKDLERDYGIGFRFNTDNGVVFRVDAAFGSRDGKHLHIVAGGIF
jgi:hypothetical protein